MDNRRLVLSVALAAILFIMYQQWQKDYPAVAPSQVTQTQSPTAPSVPGETASTNTSDSAVTPNAPTQASSRYVSVKTDVFDIQINTTGANIQRLGLPKYPDAVDTPDTPFQLLNDSFPVYFIAQSAMRKIVGGEFEQIDWKANYETEKSSYQLTDGQDQLVVPFTYTNEDGLTLVKTYTFKRGMYDVDVSYTLQNGSGEAVTAQPFYQLQRTAETGVEESSFIVTYTGAVFSTEEKLYQKFDFDDMEDGSFKQRSQGGWVAMIQHYFMAAWVPNSEESNYFYSTKPTRDGRYTAGVVAPRVDVPVGGSFNTTQTFYAGPKIQSTLEELAPGLELTVDFGFLTVIAKPIFWLLNWLHDLLGNWGWAIVVLTLIIKLAFYKLSEISYKSMANMRKLAPRMQQLKERHGDDRQAMQQAMMKMYKEEKINPLSGCLPMLVPIPVFIALYWVLLESVEIRQAEWIFWYNDLSQSDPYFVLPIIMAASMFLQQKLNPTPPDPIQARMMMIMPLVFSVMFLFFPSGLVLYWVVNNIASIAQQYVITKRVEQGGDSSKKK